MLTKEECEKALSEIEYSLCELEETKTGVDVYCLFDENLEIVKQLIKEHFNPQPYKFEELEEGMLVWDNQQKKFIKVNRLKRVIISMNNYKCYIYCDIPIEFEENRFFPITKVNQ